MKRNKEELEKIRGLKGKARITYIWDYYKLWIIGITFAVFFVGYIANMMLNAVSDHWLYITFVNTTQDLGTNSDIWDEYMDRTGYDLSQGLVEFNANSYFDYMDNQAKNNKYYEMFVTYIDAGTLDAAVMETDALLAIGETGRFLDLDSESCASIKEKYGDRFLYCTPLDDSYNGEQVAIGIDITDSRLMTEYGIYPEGTSCALAIGAFSENQDAVEAFLDMIFDEENLEE